MATEAGAGRPSNAVSEAKGAPPTLAKSITPLVVGPGTPASLDEMFTRDFLDKPMGCHSIALFARLVRPCLAAFATHFDFEPRPEDVAGPTGAKDVTLKRPRNAALLALWSVGLAKWLREFKRLVREWRTSGSAPDEGGNPWRGR